MVPEPVLFERAIFRDIGGNGVRRADGGFEVLLEGEFESGDEYWEAIAEMAAWVIEIRADAEVAKIHFAIAPTRRTRDANPDARGYSTTIAHPDPARGPYFDARILVREGHLKGKGARHRRTWVAKRSGIRVYLEGFRVLPYGDDDWLSIDADYAGRARQLEMLRHWPLAQELEDADPDEGLTPASSRQLLRRRVPHSRARADATGPGEPRRLRAGGGLRHACPPGSHGR